MSKRTLLIVGGAIVVATIAVTIFFLLTTDSPPIPESIPEPAPAAEVIVATSSITTIGSSLEGREITAHTFGTGSTSVLLVGGIHGGYEWNSTLLAYAMIDYFTQTPESIPASVTVHIIPNLNPDGLFEATGLEGRFAATDIPARDIHTAGIGRFNANSVDLNRNFDCKWAPESTWRGRTVSAGTAPFSEPEAAALRDYVLTTKPVTVVFWHSQANTVYASECETGVLPLTLSVMNAYAEAGNYKTQATFDAYPVTGDAEGWLASIGIPAITVELETRTSIEWERNLAGTLATLHLLAEAKE
jgi:predicted deacylase